MGQETFQDVLIGMLARHPILIHGMVPRPDVLGLESLIVIIIIMMMMILMMGIKEKRMRMMTTTKGTTSLVLVLHSYGHYVTMNSWRIFLNELYYYKLDHRNLQGSKNLIPCILFPPLSHLFKRDRYITGRVAGNIVMRCHLISLRS